MSDNHALALEILRVLNEKNLSFNGKAVLEVTDGYGGMDIVDAFQMLVDSKALYLEDGVYILPQNRAKPKPVPVPKPYLTGTLNHVCCVCQNRDGDCPNCNGQWTSK